MSLRKELLKKSKEQLDVLKIPFKIKKERKQLESWILDREEKVVTLEYEINEAKSNDTLNIESILDKIDSLDLTKRRLAQGQELLKELY